MNLQERTRPNTEWKQKNPIMSDLGYLVTQEGFLCDEKGQKIIFHTGNYEEKETEWTTTRIY